MNQKRKISIFIFVTLVAFWFYNFRWVEFYPSELDMSKQPNLFAIFKRGIGSESVDKNGKDSWDKVSEDQRNLLKQALIEHHQDYIEKNNRLYIRAFLARDDSEITNYTRFLFNDGGGEQRYGFFPKYTGYNEFSYFLYKLIMWNWNEQKKD
jgi:hypothetical protein